MWIKPAGLLIGALFISVLLGACSQGVKFDPALVSQSIKKGESTDKDVLMIAGHPTSKSYNANNQQVWRYAYVDKQVTGVGVLTSVVGIGTQYKTESRVMDVYFTDNVVTDVKIETTNSTSMQY